MAGKNRKRWLIAGAAVLALLVATAAVLYFVVFRESISFPLETWLLAGAASALVLGLSYVLVLRRRLVLLPVASAVGVALGLVREGQLAAFPGARSGAVLGIVVLAAAAIWWQGRYAADQRD